MAAFLDVKEIKEKVSILSLLKKLGFAPVKESGGEHFFLSMLREEYTASLCVNDKLGVWFDHGGAGVSGIRSGSVIDFGLAYWYPTGFPEVLHKIVEYANVSIDPSQSTSYSKNQIERPAKVPRYAIERVEELGTNAAISAYLDSRGIGSVARGSLYEVYYSVLDDKNKLRNFFASGWPNENGGWEVRNKYFKGCLGHKGVTFLEGSAKRLCVFEGYFDFLSWRVEHEKDPASVLVLNSLSLLQTAKARADKFDIVELYFDHDKAGRAATDEFVADVELSRDCSWAYAGFKDYNEKILASLKSRTKIEFASRFSNNDPGLSYER